MFDQLRLRWRAEATRKTGRKICVSLDVAIALLCIGYIIFGVVFSYQPGPTTYYNHFVGILLADFLIFTCFQHFLLTLNVTKFYEKPWKHALMWIYWVTIAISGLICGVGYSVVFKPECLAMGFVTCLIAKIAWCQLLRTKCRASSRIPHTLVDEPSDCLQRSESGSSSSRRVPTPFKHPALSHEDRGVERDSSQPSTHGGKIVGAHFLGSSTTFDASTAYLFKQAAPAYKKLRLTKALRTINRILKVMHWIIAILNASGAIVLAHQNRYSNPGTLVRIALPNGLYRNFNYNCTVPASHNATMPTIWFEADASHGIVDFLGLQAYLATQHSIPSCSYDPPNFGWSDPLPAWYTNWDTYLPALLTAIGQENQTRIYAGWGAGLESSLKHAIADQAHAVAVIDLDASPDGIEFFDAQRANNWTDAQRLVYRHEQLEERASFTRTLLTLGIGWGLTPVFVPGNSSGYFSRSLYPQYHAQGLKDAFWTMQYFLLLQEAAAPTEDVYLNSTVLPSGIKFGAIMTENPMPGNAASNEYYRAAKIEMVEHIGGGHADVQWCPGGCTLSFPVDQAEWAAGIIVAMVQSML